MHIMGLERQIHLAAFFWSFDYREFFFQGNLVLSTELITQIGYRKEFKGWRERSVFKLFTVANLRYQLSW